MLRDNCRVANISSNTNTGTTVITQVAQKNPSELLYISLSFGFSLAVNAWVFFRISGGLFNPAVSPSRTFRPAYRAKVDICFLKPLLILKQVTVGMVLIGAISIVRGVLLFVIQIVAGIVAAYIVQALFQGQLAVSTTLGGGTTRAQGVIIEMILTAQLVFTIFMLAAEKHQGNFIAPVGIGLSLFIAELVGESPTHPGVKTPSSTLLHVQFRCLIMCALL